jgi:large subunit ribosomal protein L31
MKAAIHPDSKITQFICACGNQFTALSTLGGSHHVEICSACHPYFTGREKLMDTAGRIEKFNRRYKRGAKAEGAADAKAEGAAVIKAPPSAAPEPAAAAKS